MKVISIVQARMGSTRLPGKALKPIEGKAMTWHVLNRLKRSKSIQTICLATTDKKEDSALLELANNMGVNSFAGSETNVLDRYYQCATAQKSDHVVRLTGDCPLIDPEVTDAIINKHLESGADYTSNTLERSFPRGLDTEVMTYDTLKKVWEAAVTDGAREHVTQYIRLNRGDFRVEQVVANPSLKAPDFRFCVDTEEDFEFVASVYHYLYRINADFKTQSVLDLLDKRPELKKINEHVQQKQTVKHEN